MDKQKGCEHTASDGLHSRVGVLPQRLLHVEPEVLLVWGVLDDGNDEGVEVCEEVWGKGIRNKDKGSPRAQSLGSR